MGAEPHTYCDVCDKKECIAHCKSATPYPHRCADVKPNRIQNLRVAPDDEMVEICWDGVENNGCVDRYEWVHHACYVQQTQNAVQRGIEIMCYL